MCRTVGATSVTSSDIIGRATLALVPEVQPWTSVFMFSNEQDHTIKPTDSDIQSHGCRKSSNLIELSSQVTYQPKRNSPLDGYPPRVELNQCPTLHNVLLSKCPVSNNRLHHARRPEEPHHKVISYLVSDDSWSSNKLSNDDDVLRRCYLIGKSEKLIMDLKLLAWRIGLKLGISRDQES